MEAKQLTKAVLLGGSLMALANAALAAEYLKPTVSERSYAAGVVTKGGRTVWLAGMGGTNKSDGTKITDFAEQTRQAFRRIDATLKQAGGSLDDLVSMTVMIRNQSDGDTFVKVRGEFFKNNKFPASMLITAKDFANSDILVEIQSVAVIGDTLKAKRHEEIVAMAGLSSGCRSNPRRSIFEVMKEAGSNRNRNISIRSVAQDEKEWVARLRYARDRTHKSSDRRAALGRSLW
jgi:2-iminobutanoate/2-iminopropanoate deaminase